MNDIVFEVTDIQQVSCFGRDDGRATVSISQIQSPYNIVWDNGLPDAVVTNLPAGNHTVTISDANHCAVTKQFLVDTPSQLSVGVSNESSPICFGDCNGRIEIVATGGMGSYSYEWVGKNISAPILSNVCAGEHLVRITDANGCRFDKMISLAGPEQISIELENSYTICEGQKIALNAGVWANNHWSSNNGFANDNAVVSLTRAGNYNLSVKNDKGCLGAKSFEVIYSSELLSAEFLLPKETYVGDTVVCVEISAPEPDEINWNFDNADVLTAATHGAYKELMFLRPGEYNIMLTAKLGACISHQTKRIVVYPSQDEDNDGGRLGYKESGIKEIKIYPNPNDGNFTVKVTLYKQGAVRLRLSGLTGNILREVRGDNANEYEFNFNLINQTAGVYWLNTEADNTVKTVRVLIY